MKHTLHVILAALLAHIALSERMIGDPGNGERIPLDIKVEGHLVTVVSGKPDPPQPFFTQSINLYDFDAKREARKVVEDGVCFIKGLNVEFNQAKKFLKALRSSANHVTTHVSEEWNVPGHVIEPENLENTVGANIAEFCSGYDVIWMKPGRKVFGKVRHRVKRQWTGSLGAGYKGKTGFSGNAGLNYSKNNWKFSGKLSYSQKGGFGASVGVTFKF